MIVCWFLVFFFFFSSRRRHTRCYRDWSSDVCSSDLGGSPRATAARARPSASRSQHGARSRRARSALRPGSLRGRWRRRSEERRVGKECRCRWSTYQEEKEKERDEVTQDSHKDSDN